MNKTEYSKILNKIVTSNKIFPYEMQECREIKKDKINSFEDIFQNREVYDFQLLDILISYLGNEDEKIIRKTFYEETNPTIDETSINIPHEDKVLVATALKDNMLFFSMAYNWINLLKYKINNNNNSEILNDLVQSQRDGSILINIFNRTEEENIDLVWEPEGIKIIAGLPGFPSIKEKIIISDLGEILISTNTKFNQVSFSFKKRDISRITDFKFEITFITKIDNIKHTVVIDCNLPNEKIISSAPIKADFKNGITIINFKKIPNRGI